MPQTGRTVAQHEMLTRRVPAQGDVRGEIRNQAVGPILRLLGNALEEQVEGLDELRNPRVSFH